MFRANESNIVHIVLHWRTVGILENGGVWVQEKEQESQTWKHGHIAEKLFKKKKLFAFLCCKSLSTAPNLDVCLLHTHTCLEI